MDAYASQRAEPRRNPAESPVASDRVAFSLGWDFAFYGIPCHDPDQRVREGFAAGQQRFGPRGSKIPDRFERKWLLLRSNAWRRQRVFSEAVTPDYLRKIDLPLCPILRIPLTHGAQLDTDWSVDRINNDGAYAPGNLAVLSVRANAAKGSLDFEAVLERSRHEEGADGLTGLQWLRLASIMAAPCFKSGASAPVMPLLVLNLPDVPVLFCQYLQSAFLLEVCGRRLHLIRPIRKGGGLECSDRARFETLIKKMRKRVQQRPPLEQFWFHPSLFSHFCTWYTALARGSRKHIHSVLSERVGIEAAFVGEDWCLNTLGYYAQPPDCRGAAAESTAVEFA